MTENNTQVEQTQAGEFINEQGLSIADEMKAMFEAAKEPQQEVKREEPKEELKQETKEEVQEESPKEETLAEKELPLVPSNWSKDEREAFEKLKNSDNEDIRLAYEVLAARAEQMQKGLYKKFEDIASERKSYQGLNEVLKPYEQAIKANNLTPAQYVNAVISEIASLNKDPVAKVKEIIRAYDLKPEQLGIDEFGFTEDDKDVKIEKLEKELKNIQNAMRYNQEVAPVENQLAQFVNATDSQGKLLHPHFDKVRLSMAEIMQEDANLDLKGAYEKAVKARGLMANTESDNSIDITKLREKVSKAVKASRAIKPSASTPDFSKMSILDELKARASGSF